MNTITGCFSLVLIMACLSLISPTAFSNAGPPEVKITSFVGIGGTTRLGEVCGVVLNNDNTSVKLNVIADPKTKEPGAYHTFTGIDGKFCDLIHTTSGTVDVGIVGAQSSKVVSAGISR